MNPISEYKRKLRSAEEAVRIVKSGDWVDYGLGLSQPIALDAALAARKSELRDVKFRSALSLAPRQVVLADPDRESFVFNSWHFGGYER